MSSKVFCLRKQDYTFFQWKVKSSPVQFSSSFKVQSLLLSSHHARFTFFTRQVACVASVPVGSFAHSRHFLLFGGSKIGASATLMEGAGRGRGARPNFRAFKKRKMLQTCGKPYGNACYADYTAGDFCALSRVAFARSSLSGN